MFFQIDPVTRPTAEELGQELIHLFDVQAKSEVGYTKHQQSVDGKIHLRKVGHKRSLSEEEIVVRRSPSEKARFHYLASLPSSKPTVMSIGKEMSMRDPHYRPALANPFATLPRLREGKKIIGSSRDLFSSCFELPSPARVGTPTGSFFDTPTKSTSLFNLLQPPEEEAKIQVTPRSRFEDHLFHGRVELLKRLYSGGTWTTQDDSVLSSFSSASSSSAASGASSLASSSFSNGGRYLRRRGSCESGFCSSLGTVDDWLMESMQLSTATASATRSMGSSLLTVSDLEEDLRAASAFLSSTHKRTSSIFTDSTDDLSSLAEAIGPLEDLQQFEAACSTSRSSTGYEKDIRDIVEYFEASCRVSRPRGLRLQQKYRPRLISSSSSSTKEAAEDNSLSLPRSLKIESLIKRVVEKESRDRLRKTSSNAIVAPTSQQQQRLQVCDGIVRSKLQVFDETKRPPSRMPCDHKGFVKAKLAIFDNKGHHSAVTSTTGNAKRLAEKRLLALANASKNPNSGIRGKQKEFKLP
jgi:hypothetical protein